VLTDPPRVVDLKREFRALDARTEELKQDGDLCGSARSAELIRVELRKAEIAREIFANGALGTVAPYR